MVRSSVRCLCSETTELRSQQLKFLWTKKIGRAFMESLKKFFSFRLQNNKSPPPPIVPSVKDDLDDSFIRDPRAKVNAFSGQGKLAM